MCKVRHAAAGNGNNLRVYRRGEVFEYLWAVAWNYSRARFVRLLVFLFHRIHVLVGIMQYLIGTSRFAGLGCIAYR